MNVFSEKYIGNTERGTIRWIMLLESLQFLIGNPEWWFTKPLLVVLTSLETSALVPDVAAKNCLPQTKSPGSNIEVLGTYACFATITTLLWVDRHHWLQPHWLCVTMTSLWSHTVTHEAAEDWAQQARPGFTTTSHPFPPHSSAGCDCVSHTLLGLSSLGYWFHFLLRNY